MAVNLTMLAAPLNVPYVDTVYWTLWYEARFYLLIAVSQFVLRRRTPACLNEPQVRPMIAGVSPAHRRHGGDGALYVALKRRS